MGGGLETMSILNIPVLVSVTYMLKSEGATPLEAAPCPEGMRRVKSEECRRGSKMNDG